MGMRVGGGGHSLVGQRGGSAERKHTTDATVTFPNLFPEAPTPHCRGVLRDMTVPAAETPSA